MSKARRKNTPVIPSSVMFDIPDMYQSTLTNTRFLLIDIFLKRGQDRVLIFASDEQLNLLYESNTIFMDGKVLQEQKSSKDFEFLVCLHGWIELVKLIMNITFKTFFD